MPNSEGSVGSAGLQARLGGLPRLPVPVPAVADGAADWACAARLEPARVGSGSSSGPRLRVGTGTRTGILRGRPRPRRTAGAGEVGAGVVGARATGVRAAGGSGVVTGASWRWQEWACGGTSASGCSGAGTPSSRCSTIGAGGGGVAASRPSPPMASLSCRQVVSKG